MPPKSVTCSICSETVLKAQTYALSNGTRACRSHEGVADEAEKRQAEERAKLSRDAERHEMQSRSRFRSDPMASLENFEKHAEQLREKFYHHCWICECEGLEGREFFTQALIASKRLQLRGEFNFLTYGQDVRKLMDNIVLLMAIKLEDQVQDKAVIKHVKDRRVREMIPLVGFVMMCPQCAEKHGFKKRLEAMMPHPTFEQVQAMLPVMAVIEPLLEAWAEKKEGQS